VFGALDGLDGLNLATLKKKFGSEILSMSRSRAVQPSGPSSQASDHPSSLLTF